MNIAMIDRVVLTRIGLREILCKKFKVERFEFHDHTHEAIDWTRYDLVIVNLCMNQEGYFDQFGLIKDMNPDLPILALINAYEVSIISNLKMLKIDGVVELCSDEEVFFNAVRALMSGKNYHLKIDAPKVQLTRRELEILSLVADGKTNQGIADHLFISEKTVKNHLSSLFKKIEVTNRAQAVRYAYDHGIRAN